MAWPFNVKAAPVRSSEDAPFQPDIYYMSSGYGAKIITWNQYAAMEEAMHHPIIFRALNKIAESVQTCRWFVEVDPYAAKPDQQGKAAIIKTLQSLLDSPNQDFSAAQLRYWITLNYAGYGRVPIKVGFGAVDQTKPNGLYPLETRNVQAVLNSRGAADAYIYGTGEQAQKFASRNTWKPGTVGGFVGQIWKPGLKGYQAKDDQNSPLKSVGLPAAVVTALLKRALASALGHPNVRYLITCSKSLTEPQKAALKKYINQDHGPDGLEEGRIPILQNASDIIIHKLDNDLSDIHSKMPTDDMARLIYGAFGIPIAIAGVGAADGAKFAGNYAESRQTFWQDTVIPGYIEPIFQGLSMMLCPEGVRISPDLDSIPALMPGRIMAMKEVSMVSFLTTNEKREIFGWAPTSELPTSFLESDPVSAALRPTKEPSEENPNG